MSKVIFSSPLVRNFSSYFWLTFSPEFLTFNGDESSYFWLTFSPEFLTFSPEFLTFSPEFLTFRGGA